MEDILFKVLVVLHSNAIGLGVGASSLAIAGFLTAIGDGKMDPSERKLMGVIYITLRIAMGLILVSAALIALMDFSFFGAFRTPMWILIGMLFLNAILMTKHWITPKLGPAIQAGTWYTLGFLITIYIFEYMELTLLNFAIFYGVMFTLAVLVVNGCMLYLKKRQSAKATVH